jgi:hypothetical protein
MCADGRTFVSRSVWVGSFDLAYWLTLMQEQSLSLVELNDSCGRASLLRIQLRYSAISGLLNKDGSLAAEHIMPFRTVTVRTRGLTILGRVSHSVDCRLLQFVLAFSDMHEDSNHKICHVDVFIRAYLHISRIPLYFCNQWSCCRAHN